MTDKGIFTAFMASSLFFVPLIHQQAKPEIVRDVIAGAERRCTIEYADGRRETLSGFYMDTCEEIVMGAGK